MRRMHCHCEFHLGEIAMLKAIDSFDNNTARGSIKCDVYAIDEIPTNMIRRQPICIT